MNDALTRFMRKVDTSGDCWTWTAARTSDGYGYFRAVTNGQTFYRAHRYAYTVLVGPIPDGMQLDHLCRNRACVNPAHLEPVSGAENTRRAKAVITHCPHGHEYTPENTMARPRGDRECRTCQRARASRYAANKRATDPAWVESKKEYLRGYHRRRVAASITNQKAGNQE